MNMQMMKRFAHGAAVPVAVLLLWQALSTFGWINPQILPSPVAVLVKWYEYLIPMQAYTPEAGNYLVWMFSGELPHDAWASLSRVLGGFAIGAGLALLGANIVVTAAAIGFSTFVMVTLGVMLGRVLGTVAGRRAELVGGLVLIVIGCVILYEHLGHPA
ncbi:MAG: manganese efflux pump [Janthinobacterium sp.]